MILIVIGSLTLLASLVVLWRRAVEMRAIRWQLYHLRDELRRAAFADRALLSSDIFCVLDTVLTRDCATLDELSLWTIVPTLPSAQERERMEATHRHFVTRLHQPQHVALVPIYNKSAILFARHLAWRHMLLSSISIVTIVGIRICRSTGTWLSQRILSGAMKPVSAGTVSQPHAVNA